ncbi:MAG: hypothetical protein ACRETP_09540, partial [Steroidobacteraceae bacterium]
MTLRSTLLPPTLLSLSLLFTACGPGGALGGGEGGFAAPEVVLTISTSGSGTPDPNNVYEVAVTNLDGSGFRQLTSDGK